MKLLILCAVFLTGCATQTEQRLQACCKSSAGTPADHFYSSTPSNRGAYQVMTPAGGYLVVPNASTGRPMAIIQTSKGK